MDRQKFYRSLTATCLSASLMLLCGSGPGWARNPYRDGHVAPGASKQTIDKARREAARRNAEARARESKEARSRGHQQDRQGNSDGKFVRHPDVPVAGVDQKGGVYDKVRRDNPDVQRAVYTPRRVQNQGGTTPTIQPINQSQQPANGQPNQAGQPRPPLQRGSLLSQTELVEQRRQAFEQKYRENCARTHKPNCDPPNSQSSAARGTSSYEETGSRAN
ncbi:MAG TPA: hypothetical protein VMT22_22030 [Terriglobales bacterium]|nr:hypothetical protein [Terriglobales bacterium]